MLLFLLLLLKPIMLLLRRCSALRLALNVHATGLIRLQLARDVPLLGGFRRGRGRPLLHVAVGIRRLDGGGLVGLELFEVQILDEVRWVEGSKC